MAATWKAPPGYSGWEVSSDGKVRKHGEIKTPFKMNTGYLAVSIHRAPVTVHRLVCMAFHGMPPEGKPYACHKDGNPLNNAKDNLYWGSAQDNAEDARLHGTLATGVRHGAHMHPDKFDGTFGGNGGAARRKLTVDQAAFVRENYTPRHPILNGKALAEKFGVDPATIRKVHAGTTYAGV